MKMEPNDIKRLIKIFLTLSEGFSSFENLLDKVGLEVNMKIGSPLLVSALGDFILDMMGIPEDKEGQHRDWYYSKLYGSDIELTVEGLTKAAEEIYNEFTKPE